MTNPTPNGPTDGQPPTPPKSPDAANASPNSRASSRVGPASADGFPSPLIDYSARQSAGVASDDLVSAEDEMLVAYLDGELDADAVMTLESQMASQPRLKRRLDELRSAWDLLEELPPARPSPNFAQSTIEMVAMSAAAVEASPIQRRRNRWWWIATLVIAPIMLVAGYTVTRASQRYTERHTIEQVHLLADWDALKAVDNMAWLEKLAQVPDITRVAKRAATSGLGVDIVPPTVPERRQWIQSLSPTDRDRLSANLEEFKRVSPTESQRLLKLADQIYEHKDRDQLLQLARSYSVFLTDMSIKDRTSHRDLKNEEIRLSDLKWRVDRKLVEVHASELSAEDRGTIAEWVKRMQDTYGEILPRGGVYMEMWRIRTGGDSVITEDDLDQLFNMLSTESQDILGRLPSKEDIYIAMAWYFVTPSPRTRVNRTELMERFHQRPSRNQTEIEFMRPEDAQEELGGGRNGSGRRPPPFRGNGR